MNPQKAATTMRAVGGVQFAIGLLALLSPSALAGIFGMNRDMDGDSRFAWRLFAIRQMLLGTGNAMRDESTEKANLAIQALDLGLFGQALRSGSVPRRTAIMALGTAGSVTAGSLLARAGGRPGT
ncbi:MAG TPA: hypothetical protein VD931_00995 [Baekduia sp.]|nr:hypothetical protein [Baekduia sp.]